MQAVNNIFLVHCVQYSTPSRRLVDSKIFGENICESSPYAKIFQLKKQVLNQGMVARSEMSAMPFKNIGWSVPRIGLLFAYINKIAKTASGLQPTRGPFSAS